MRVLAIAVLLFLAGVAKADTGYELQQECVSKRGGPYCLGFISGVMGTLYAWQLQGEIARKGDNSTWSLIASGAPYYCPPDGINLGQSQQIVVKWLNEHPEQLHLPASDLVRRALESAFPCPRAP